MLGLSIMFFAQNKHLSVALLLIFRQLYIVHIVGINALSDLCNVELSYFCKIKTVTFTFLVFCHVLE